MPSAYRKGDLQGYVRQSSSGDWRIETWEGEEIGKVTKVIQGKSGRIFIEIIYEGKLYYANATIGLLWRGRLRRSVSGG